MDSQGHATFLYLLGDSFPWYFSMSHINFCQGLSFQGCLYSKQPGNMLCLTCPEGQREDVFLSRIIKISPMPQRFSRFLATPFKRWDCLNSRFLSCDTNPACAWHPPGLPSTSPAISLGWGRKEGGCECEAHPACHAVSNQAFFFKPRVLYLLPTSMKWGRLIC